MAFTPKRVERSIEFRGEEYTLVFDMETVARFEEMTGRSIFKLALTGMDDLPLMSDMGSMLLAALSENHPDLTRAHAMEMATDPEMQALFNDGLQSSMPQPGDVGEGAGGKPPANPPKRRKKKRGDGKAS